MNLNIRLNMDNHNIFNEEEYVPAVLLVSNREDDRKVISSAVRSGCSRFLEAGTAEETQEALLENHVAVLIFDLDLYECESKDIISFLKSRGLLDGVPFIFIAEKEMAEKASFYYSTGACDFLLRPVDTEGMKNKIDFFTDHFRLKKQNNKCAAAEANRLNKGLADLAGGIAHQFNNILNIITGHVELLKMDLPENANIGVFSTLVFDSVKRMTALTDKLLAYARAKCGGKGNTDINDLVSSCVDTSAGAFENISFDIELDPGEIFIDADNAKMAMVVMALLENAVEAVESSGKIRVSTKYITENEISDVAPSGHFVRLQVEDNGVGMEKNVADRMFDPFFSTKFQGRGLDMAAVQGLVEGCSGFIDVLTSPGKGTSISVHLPVSSYRPSTLSSSSKNSDLQSSDFVLAIDDDQAVRELTVTMLERLGYEAIPASSGIEAVEIVKRMGRRISVVIIDIGLSDIKGDKLYPMLKKLNPDLKVIVCSGYDLNGRGEAMIKEGARIFMQKPYSFSELASVMRKLLERRKEKRYQVKDGYAFMLGNRGLVKNSLVDISRSGAAVLPFEPEPSTFSGWGELDLVSASENMMIKDVPFKVVSSFNSLDFSRKARVENSRFHLKFGELSAEMLEDIDSFISYYRTD